MTFPPPLVKALLDHQLGLCGQHDPAIPAGGIEDLERRLSILTFGVVLDANPLGREDWSLLTDLQTHWLFDPSRVGTLSSEQIREEFRRVSIRAPKPLARVWWQICRGVQGRTKGSWRELFRLNEENAQSLLGYLGNSRTTFPVLSGPVISARWLDLVHRVGGIELLGWETLRVPLSGGWKKTASLFGITMEVAHPAFLSALQAWTEMCQMLPTDQCGLAECPRRILDPD
jgi:hypothetical protein